MILLSCVSKTARSHFCSPETSNALSNAVFWRMAMNSPPIFSRSPHHGGKTSSTPPFLDAVHPAVAAISVGEANPFGHPSREAVERILAEGTRLYRTDRDGAITASTDGQSLDLRSFLTCARPCSELSSSASPAESPAF
jgi:hypothetical protein